MIKKKSKYRILHLEDVKSDAELAARELRKSIDFDYLVIDSEKAYLDALETFFPDVILCDHSLPSFNSLEALKIVKRKKLHIPFILLTATMSEEVAANVVREGADDYILKDRLKRLPNAVINAMEKYRHEKERKVLIDTAHQKELLATKNLQENEAKYRSIFENSLDAILLTSENGKILAANPSACAIFRMTEKEICEKGRFGIVDETDPRLHVLLEARRSTGKVKGETTFIRGDGSKFPGEVSSAVFKDAGGADRTAMVIRDISDRKKAEERLVVTSQSLQQALGELKKIMDSSIDVICSTDKEGRFLNVSAAAKTVWGYTPEELIGKKYIDLTVKEDREITLATAESIIGGIPVTMFENRFIHKNGSIVPLLWSAKWDDNEQKMFSIAKDATEKKSMEKALENERLRYYEVFNEAPSAIAILKGADHRFQMVNPCYLQLTGKKNVIGQKAKEIVPELESQGFLDLLDHVYKSGTCFTGKEILVKHDIADDGCLKDHYINFIYQPYRNHEGTVEGIFFFANDVTEQVVSRKKIEASEKQFRQIVETAQEGIWMLDENNLTRFVNAKMCSILEYSEEEMIGKSPQIFSRQKTKRSGHDGFTTGVDITIDMYEEQFVTKSGASVWVRLSTNPIVDDEGNYKGALAMVTDITERKRLEEKIIRQKVQQQKEITKAALQVQEKERNFLGSELHDNINQILTAVKLQLKVYIDNEIGDKKIVINSHSYLETAIEEIRKLSQRLVTHRFDVDSFTEAVRFMIQGLSIGGIVTLNVERMNDDAIHESIKLTLFRIVQEQLNNISKYAKATKVTVTISNDSSEVNLDICDDGIGFNTKEKRTGVGLTNIYNRVESYNGRVDIVSAPGQGCHVEIHIPLQQPLSLSHI